MTYVALIVGASTPSGSSTTRMQLGHAVAGGPPCDVCRGAGQVVVDHATLCKGCLADVVRGGLEELGAVEPRAYCPACGGGA